MSQPVSEAPAAVTIIDQDTIRVGFPRHPRPVALGAWIHGCLYRPPSTLGQWAITAWVMRFRWRFLVLVDGHWDFIARTYGAVYWGDSAAGC